MLRILQFFQRLIANRWMQAQNVVINLLHSSKDVTTVPCIHSQSRLNFQLILPSIEMLGF